ncbi:hypothetical protein LBRM_06_1180 [Leishmania braziliensis MHOM/BR/75/M2904]|uniref:Uncharacterized protein n=2 Tax=Leishmania braziliensis TaxID=5660 RepID=A4H4T1_LEIBR|nr:hypothetical protein LBRM_06_1180 [Leishmania braziliensis MHOM/BR/75/M2904]CAJ2466722.1 unnamed protein product [Leishmania braziliensis]CAM37076.1 hypothetical protein LBRM_06_1180 [Leishmania braziliensis MHOM/BR/75/M2904]SYZ62951.1 hypothetical_protein [Leishmania braziliensis MHOM/BR/75/M2904]
MPSYPHTTGACRSGDMATGTSGKATRRRIVCCAAPTTTVRVAEIYTLHAKENDPFKSTVCMDYHVLSRIEGDLRRAEMRQENPESVMPDRGYLHDQEAYRTWDEYITTKQSPSSNRSVVGSLYPSSRGESRLPPIMLPRARSRRGSASSSHYASVPNSTLNTPTSNRRSGAPGSNRKGRQMSRSLSPGGQAHSSAHSSPWQHKGSSPTHQLPSLYPPNDRLGPAHSTCKAPKWRKEAGCCEVNGAAAAWNSHKTGRKHSLELSELEEGHEQQTVTDAERERRLHLADELASRMESAVPCVLKERREAG